MSQIRKYFAVLSSIAVLSLTLGVHFSSAQESAAEIEPLTESVQVRVVNVDVSVTDSRGTPVRGLTRGDFRIFEDGNPQEISNFYAIEHTRVRSLTDQNWVPIEENSKFRRRMVLLIDNNTLSKPVRDRAIEKFHQFLDQKFDGTYEWAVIAVDDEVKVLLPLTSDKFQVRAALDRIRSMPTNQSRYATDRSVLNDPVRIRMSQRASQATTGQIGGTPVGGGGDEMTDALRFQSQFNMYRNLEATLRTAEAMIQAFQAYSRLEGKKILVLVTGGIQMLPEYSFQESDGDSSNEPVRGTPTPPTDDSKLHGLYLRLREVLDDVVEAANAAGFNLYPVKASGIALQSPQLDVGFRSSGATLNSGASISSPEIDDSDSGQMILAQGTGGLYMTSNRVLESFESIDSDTAAFYSIGYSPNHDIDGKKHKIRVELTNPDLKVRARQGYVDLSDEQKLELYLSSPLSFEKEKGSLPVEIEIEQAKDQTITATAVLPMSEVTFFERDGIKVGRVYIYLTIYDDAGEARELVRRTQDLTFPADRTEEALSNDLRYALRFQLDERGRYSISVTLRDELSNEIGSAIGEVQI